MPHKSLAQRNNGQIALALGAGGARGLAHVIVLEVLDELGLRPCMVAGSSMGAILGAVYCAGFSGKDIRQHILQIVRDKPDVMARLLKARVGRITDLFTRGLANPVLLDGEEFLRQFWPKAMPENFEALQIPFTAVATDFLTHEAAIFKSGPLIPAVAGSMAIPGLIRPVAHEAQVLIDGGAVNPLPFDLVQASCVIAVDVTGGPQLQRTKAPEPFEAMFGAAQIMQTAITREKLKNFAPDLLFRPQTDHFSALNFFSAREIFKSAEPLREDIKRALDKSLSPRALD